MSWGIWRERCGTPDDLSHWHPWLKEPWTYKTKKKADKIADELNAFAKMGTSEFWGWKFSAKEFDGKRHR